MVFGRKKKETEAEVEQENDLALAYGAPEVDGENDDAESVPPPPPNADAKDGQEESLTDDGESVEANEYKYASTAGDDDEKEEDPHARKKLAVIACCVLSFIIFLSLSINLGVVRKQSKNVASLSEANSQENGSVESPIAEVTQSPTELEAEFTLEPTLELTVDPTLYATGDFAVVDVEPPSEEEVDVGTVAPSAGGTQGFTPDDSEWGTSEIDVSCSGGDVISVTSSCQNGAGFAELTFCSFIDSQFWEWIVFPETYTPPGRGWGWMTEIATRQFADLPNGSYSMSVFGNGDQDLAQYPTVSSTEFTISC
mmetsp:Transcript_16849/g.38634  ORF Transcript_16849/g.38634 Transcript_16849/m.38634 type:complete len:311 (+) Transcript_16849:162-1094(+)|eukprot:CAMPEP_0172394424 /NCGR_PEP_ID=MMETSP1061-20121228/14836_1 /TAXON_ID=37318 /ORGANISM="Pseudo-nitzschia pungens, Strain cf. pungens" /LENGTH=310 /DNA_ID=CAMNT_0013125769 /DNA_START=103 /DNA_END=1035 /DNA_ORIENTATION=-